MEILVVLVIASILAAITLGGYSAMRASNRRTSCQANMTQIYQAIRLYSADYDGNVPYYDPNNTLGNGTGLGLWALYTFAEKSSVPATTPYTFGNQAVKPADADIMPEKRYLTNPKLFNCPGDIAGTNDQLYQPVNPPIVPYANSTYNPNYLSYQTSDTGCPDPSDTTCGTSNGQYGTPQLTYNPIVTNAVSSGLAWQRQLLTYNGSTLVNRPPTDDTVVLWCPFHRGGGSASTDNVLFWDGTLQSIPETQVCPSGTWIGAQRVPLVACN